jgi:hypothetical protein
LHRDRAVPTVRLDRLVDRADVVLFRIARVVLKIGEREARLIALWQELNDVVDRLVVRCRCRVSPLPDLS